MIVAAALLSILFQSFVQTSQAWKALDPEQVWYVYERCHEDHLPTGAERATYLKTWKFWKLEPNDAVTHCYIKCTLAGLEVYDEKDKSFKADRVLVQHNAYKSYNEADTNKVNQLQQALSTLNVGGGSCQEVFNAYLPVHNKLGEIFRKLYHGRVEAVNRIYAATPQLKTLDESFFKHCSKKVWGEGYAVELNKVRNHELTGSEQMKQAVECVFHGFRYMDDGELKVDEVVRDFNLINKSASESEVRSVLANCKGTTAYDYYTCLLNSSVKEDFKNALDFHELRSAKYGYLAHGKTYEGHAQVKEELKKLYN